MKKILLLASMALALVAFAAPAAQAAPNWIDAEGNTLGEEAEPEINISGSLSSLSLATGLTSGPCKVTFTGVAKNENGMAGGKVTGGTIEKTCKTQIPGCEFEPTLENFPWALTGITVTNNEDALEIQNAAFENHYNNTCVALGIPATVTATGTATGILESGTGSLPGDECLTFNGHRDHLLVGGVAPIDIEGTVCLDEADGISLETHLTG